jgi:hypothetical protein
VDLSDRFPDPVGRAMGISLEELSDRIFCMSEPEKKGAFSFG